MSSELNHGGQERVRGSVVVVRVRVKVQECVELVYPQVFLCTLGPAIIPRLAQGARMSLCTSLAQSS